MIILLTAFGFEVKSEPDGMMGWDGKQGLSGAICKKRTVHLQSSEVGRDGRKEREEGSRCSATAQEVRRERNLARS